MRSSIQDLYSLQKCKTQPIILHAIVQNMSDKTSTIYYLLINKKKSLKKLFITKKKGNFIIYFTHMT